MLSKKLFWGILLCWRLLTSETPQSLLPLDAETDLTNCAPRREKFAVTFADNCIKQITYFHDKLSGVLLGLLPCSPQSTNGSERVRTEGPRVTEQEGGKATRECSPVLHTPRTQNYPRYRIKSVLQKKDSSSQCSPL